MDEIALGAVRGRGDPKLFLGASVCCIAILASLVAPITVVTPIAAAAGPVVIDVGSARIVEGNAVARNISVPVVLSQPSATTVTVSYRLLAGTATGGTPTAVGADFNNAKGILKLLTFSAGQVLKNIVVPIYGDTRDENDETARIELSLPTGGATLGVAQGVVTIEDDDPYSGRAVSVGDVTVTEGDATIRTILVPITLTSPAPSSVTLTYKVLPGTANSPSDFSDNKGLTTTKVFQTGTSGFTPVQINVSVKAYPDAQIEGPETFTVKILSVSGGSSVLGDSTGTITIIDSVETPVAPDAPSAPTVSSEAPGEVEVAWIEPADGGSAITGYGITCDSESGMDRITADALGDETSVTIRGAKFGEEYACTVAASNLFGMSAPSAAAFATVRSPVAPDAPSAPSVSSDVMGEVEVAWVEPRDGGSPITDYVVVCVSETGGSPVWTATAGDESSATVASASLDEDYTCAVTAANLYGSSGASDPSETVTVEGPQFSEIAVDNSHSCGVQVDKTVACWGANESGQSSAPTGAFISVGTGYMHSCGLRVDASVVCWGGNGMQQIAAPSGSFSSVSAGQFHSCGLRVDASVVCWGYNSFGQSSPPTGSFASVTSGGYHSCGLRIDQSVVCWGVNSQGQSSAPSGSFASVSAGGVHSCGVRVDESVVCWGSNESGQSSAPSGSFSVVSAGYFHSCGVRDDQTVACWGDNGSGRATARAGAFSSVAAGNGHSCGIRLDQTVACWGGNGSGQATSPTGPVKPDAPLVVMIASSTRGEITVSWVQPFDGDSAITSNEIACTSDTGGQAISGIASGLVDSATLTGATGNEQYSCTVIAINSVGSSDASHPSAGLTVEWRTAPAAPLAPIVTKILGEITVTWVSPDDGGSAITGYGIACVSPTGGETILGETTADANAFTTSGASRGEEYACIVVATNLFGSSQMSPLSNTVTTPTAPMTPSALTVSSREAGKLVISWDAPFDGLSPIMAYDVDCVSSGNGLAFAATIEGDVTYTTFDDASPGEPYSCTSSATNLFGTSPRSLPSAIVVVEWRTAPDVPAAPSVSPGIMGQIIARWVAPPDGGSPITAYSVDCESQTGGVSIWASTDGSTDLAELSDASFGDAYTCTITALNRFGASPASANSSTVEAPGEQFSAVSDGRYHSCGLHVDASIICWGNDSYGQASALAGSFRSVSAGHYYTCGIRLDASVACWGANGSGQASAPAGSFSSVSAGGDHTCGIRVDASITCWGANGYGQASPPAGSFTSVSAGGYHTCGVRSVGGEIVCFGRNNYRQSSAPTGSFTTVSAGVLHSCGLRTNESIVCWGNNAHGQASAPSGSFSVVSAGDYHSCAIKTSVYDLSPVACWGRNTDGETSPVPGPSDASNPAQSFLSLSAGGSHSCAIRMREDVVCWGDDGFGQTILSGGAESPHASPVPSVTAPTTGGLSVAWDEPFDGGSPILQYSVICDPASSGSTLAMTVPATDTSVTTASGLSPGRPYRCKVAAENSVGEGRYSEWSTQVSTAFLPDAPAAPEVALSSSGDIEVSWIPPSDGGSPITGYRITCVSDTGGVEVTGEALAEDDMYTVVGTIGGERYTCAVSARNIFGYGPNAGQSLSVYTPWTPSRPGIPGVESESVGVLAVSWVEPFDGGSPITGYAIACVSDTGGVEVAGEAPAGESMISIPIATPGEMYTCTVSARNQFGTGEESPASSAVRVAALPVAPAIPTVSVAITGKIVVSWAAPSDGGSPITGYWVVCFGLNGAPHVYRDAAAGALTLTVSGVLVGRRYNCAVYAVNRFGWGPRSVTADTVTIRPTYYSTVSSGENGSCGITTSQSISCWGSGLGTAPVGEFSEVSRGTNHACGLRADGSIACWGYDVYGVLTNVPSGEFSAVSAGGERSCVLRSDGTITCWGRDYDPQLTNAPVGEFSAVSTGERQSCGLRVAGTIVCWGDEYNAARLIAPAGSYSAVSVGADHACAVTSSDSTIACWGNNGSGQASPPPGSFSSVSVGGYHSCGLRVDDTIACWGSNLDAKVSPVPSGSFTSLDAGPSYTCGIRTADQAMACWGKSSSYGRTTSPTGPQPPDAPGTPDISSEVMGEIVVSWTAPFAWGSPITGYDVACISSTGGVPVSAATSASALSVTIDAPMEEVYTCTVAASNSHGKSAASVASATVDVRGLQFNGVSTRDGQSCGLRVDQTIGCWGATYGYPPDGSYDSVSVAGIRACGLRVDQTIACWGYVGIPQFPNAPSGSFSSVSVGDSSACGLRVDQTIACWGDNTYGQLSAPSGSFSAVSTGGWHSCGIRFSDSAVVCWGADSAGRTTAPGGAFSAVSAGRSASCGLRVDQAIICWGTDDYGQLTAPAGSYSAVSVGGFHACGLRLDQTIVCWGRDDNGQLSVPSGSFSALSAGTSNACAVRSSDKSVVCWGSNVYGESTSPSRPTAPDAPAAPTINSSITGQIQVFWEAPVYNGGSPITEYRVSCSSSSGGRSGAMTFAGNTFVGIVTDLSLAEQYECVVTAHNMFGDSATSPLSNTVIVTGPQYVRISAGHSYSCAIRGDNKVVCWGFNSNGLSTPPSGLFSAVSAGMSHACGLRVDQTIACWGLDENGRATPPSGLFSAVSAGAFHTCALRVDQQIVCWGANEAGAATAPSGTFSAVSAGYYHTCALRVDQQIVCWGRNSRLQVSALASESVAVRTGSFLAVSVGAFHSCGLSVAQKIVCWGENLYGQSAVTTGDYSAVSAGGMHTCGIRVDDTLACWGDNAFDQSQSVPLGSFLAVSSGGMHSCGVRWDQTIACWGRNRAGETVSPTGAEVPDAMAAPVIASVVRGELVVEWHKPFDGGSEITGYLVKCYASDGNPIPEVLVDSTVRSFTTTAIAGGLITQCAVRAKNLVGTGPYAPLSLSNAVTVEWRTVPDKPSTPAVWSYVAGEVSVSWVTPDTGGSPITGYAITCESSTGGQRLVATATASAESTTIIGAPTSQVYMCQVKATNVMGTSPASDWSSAVTVEWLSAPSPPLPPSVSSENMGELKVSWFPPVANGSSGFQTGGGPIAGYIVKCDSTTKGAPVTETVVPSNQLSVDFYSLPFRSIYRCRVAAFNERFTGPFSQYYRAASIVTEQFSQIDSGTDGQFCGLRVDSTIRCWYSTSALQNALRYPGVREWFDNYSPPGYFTSVTVGGTHACGLRSDQTITCWGNNLYGQSNTYAGQFISVSAGDEHTCAVKVDWKVVCWGSNSRGQLGDLPVLDYLSVTAGASHTCATRRMDRATICWGTIDDIEAMNPYGDYRNITADTKGGCGISSDGNAACWHYGITTVLIDPSDPNVNAAIGIGVAVVCGAHLVIEIGCILYEAYYGPIYTPEEPYYLDVIVRYGYAKLYSTSEFTKVSVMGGKACAVDRTKTITCWKHEITRNGGALTTQVGLFSDVSVGTREACAIRESDKQLSCWIP